MTIRVVVADDQPLLRRGFRGFIGVDAGVGRNAAGIGGLPLADRHGVPVVRFSGELHRETVTVARAQQLKALEWLEESGATRVWQAGEVADRVPAGGGSTRPARRGWARTRPPR